MLLPEHVERFKAAISSASFYQGLWDLSVSLKAEGMSQIDIYLLFEQFQIATSGDNPRYDVIVDTMDLIQGGPWAKGNGLFASELSHEQIEDARTK